MVYSATNELANLSASKAATLIASGDLSSVNLIEALLNCVQERESVVRAWAFLKPDQIRDQARLRDASRPLGPLHGVPIGIKDVIATADQPTEFNSFIYSHNQPSKDASCVRKLREAGAIIMGKTVTAEFAYRHPGPTRNPHDPTRTPGGSSSGSAAAVAARMVPVAIATQTGGSTIRPSAYCGIFGLKPAFGAYDTCGLKYLAPSLDTIGLMARDLEDLSLIAAVLSDKQPTPIIPSSTTPTIALFRTPYSAQAEPSASESLERVAHQASEAGARVRLLDSPDWMSCVDHAHGVIMASEAARSLAYEWDNRRSELSPEIKELIDRGRSCVEEDIALARANIVRSRRWFAHNLAPGEIVLTFATAGEAPLSVSNTGNAIFNRIWSATDSACLNVPTGRGPQSMPIAVQLVDTSGDAENLLRAGQWLVKNLQVACV